MIDRLPAMAAAVIVMAPALYFRPIEAGLAALGAVVLTTILIQWRTRPVLDAAKALAHAFAFTSESCKPELQALAKAVLTWEPRNG